MIDTDSYFRSVTAYTDILHSIIEGSKMYHVDLYDKLLYIGEALMVDPMIKSKLLDAMVSGEVTEIICKQQGDYTAKLQRLGADLIFTITKGDVSLFTAMSYVYRKRNLIQIRVAGLADDCRRLDGRVSPHVNYLLELGAALGFYTYRYHTVAYATYLDGFPVYQCIQLERVLMDA